MPLITWSIRSYTCSRLTVASPCVFSSTAAVYDATSPMPLTEESPIGPSNPYGETKVAFEAHLRERAERGEIRDVVLRYFNVAGASIDHGEDHRGIRPFAEQRRQPRGEEQDADQQVVELAQRPRAP